MNWHIREAVHRLEEGGVIAYPTETVYGLGCDPLNATAVLHLINLKQRRIEQGLILVASHFEQLESYLCPVSAATRKRVTRASKQPVTWVLPCHEHVPVWLRGEHHTLAVRLTTHPVSIALCDRWNGPLVSSSANIHDRPAALTPLAVRKTFSGQLDYILHSTQIGTNQPSQIRDALSGAILRDNV
jgi:L-threonylcarbamoyladenylate synthase